MISENPRNTLVFIALFRGNGLWSKGKNNYIKSNYSEKKAYLDEFLLL